MKPLKPLKAIQPTMSISLMVGKALQPLLHLILIVSLQNQFEIIKKGNRKVNIFPFLANPFPFFEHEFSSDDEDDEMAELEMNGDQIFVIDEEHRIVDDHYPTTAKKKEIVQRLDSMRKPKTIEKLQHYFANISSLATVRRWKRKIAEDGKKN